MNPAVSRADLLRVYRELGAEGLEASAAALGYYRRGKKKEATKPLPIPTPLPYFPGSVPQPEVEHQFESAVPEVLFWRARSIEELAPDKKGGGEPEWWVEEREINVQDETGDPSTPTQPPPPKLPLLPWSRLWPFLFAALGRYCDSRRVHLHRALFLFCHARPIKRLPYVQRLTWAGQGQLLVDVHETTMPFWDDSGELLRRLTRMRGISGLEVLVFENNPEAGCRTWTPKKGLGPLKPYTLPAPGAPVLVFGDLGCLDAEEGRTLSWLRLGKRLQGAGFKPVVLLPCPPRLWYPELALYWTMVCWDRGFMLPRNPNTAGKRYFQPDTGNRELGVEWLLAMMGAAVRVEPALLRALRLLLPHGEADVGTEALVWQHNHFFRSPLACGFKPAEAADYRELFFVLPEGVRQRVSGMIRCYHAHLPGSIRAEEENIVFGVAADDATGQVTEGHLYLRRVLKAGVNGRFPKGLGEWLDRFFERQHETQFAACPVLHPLWYIRNREALEQGRVEVPEGFDFKQVTWVLGKGQSKVVALAQRGMVFTTEADQGSYVVGLEVENSRLAVETDGQRYLFNLETGVGVTFPVPLTGSVWLDTPGKRVELDTICKPKWAIAVGRDRQGLYVDIGDGKKERLVYWLPPGQYPVRMSHYPSLTFPIANGFWLEEQEYLDIKQNGFVKPDWANTMGYDSYGIYAEFTVKGVRQRMRLILPGEFKMGSPETEKERYKNETQHHVILTEGFWLADTTCTQGLWQAVMGNNPSNYKGSQRPVEQVSWEECQTFMQKIKKLKPGLKLCFPSEAQWEYACRAGTTTPFSFGENITPEQVNYDGNYPYADGKKGQYRNQTVDVKSLPCNKWGLYQMHGNVWEWCADWYGEYTADSRVNPTGAFFNTEVRVCRGGCWFSFGLLVRSAFRYRYTPADRHGYLGFRFSQVISSPARKK